MAQNMIGRYQVIDEIGRGGMAVVFRAFDPRFKRDVAIKVMTRDLLEDATLIARFEREAQTIASLEHPAIVPVYDFGEDDRRPYLVMRLMTGGTLADRLKQGPLSINDAVKILARIGSALERAHQKGIVHRDLKPSNVMFDDYGDAFLADFGIARLTESAITLTGDSVIGTPAYMSPEQIHGDKTIDGRSDIYALGVICFEMLTGQRPYEANTPAKVMMRHIIDPVPSIRAVKPDLPQGVEEVITKSMAKEPADRFSSANEITSTLTAAMGQMGTTTPAITPAPKPTETQASTVVVGPPAPAPQPPASEAITKPEPLAMPSEETQAQPLTTPRADEPSPETEISRPAFAQPPVKTAEAKPGRSRGVLIAGIVGIGLIFILAIVIGGGIFLFNRGEDQPEATSTARSTQGQAAVAEQSDTATPRPEPTEAIDPIPTAEAELDRFYEFMDTGNYDDALASIERAIALWPENSWLHHEKSWYFQIQGDYDNAFREIEVALELEPQAGVHYERRGQMRREIGDLEASLADLDRAVDLDPENPYTHMERALTLRELDQKDEAIQEINRAIELNPDESWFLVERGVTHRWQGETDQAIHDFEEAIALNPEDTGPFDELADLYAWELGDFDQAINFKNKAIELQPHDTWRYISRASYFLELGDNDGAMANYNQAIEMDPEDSWLYLHRGNMFQHSLNDPEAALADYDRAIELYPENSEAFLNRGRIYYFFFGDQDAAREDYERAIELDPDIAWYYNDREVFFTDIGEIDQALADIERCLELEPDFYWCYFDRAWIRADLGDIDGAIADFQHFLELAPEYECPDCRTDALNFIDENS